MSKLKSSFLLVALLVFTLFIYKQPNISVRAIGDTIAPIVEGVENNAYYNAIRTITFDDGTATMDGEKFTSGSQVWLDGQHTLIVKDEFDNTTTIVFTIDKLLPIVSGFEYSGVYTFGWNAVNNLGDGTTTNSSIPLYLTDNARQIAGKANTAYLVKNDNTLWAWGQCGYRSLFYTDCSLSSRPSMILDKVVSVSANGLALILQQERGLLALGTSGAAIGLDPYYSSDRKIYENTIEIWDAVKIANGEGFGMLIRPNGTLWVWGTNYLGQLGNSSGGDSVRPIQLLGNVKSIEAGGNHGLAILNDNSLWAWGYNIYGQIGNNSVVKQTTPIKIMEDVVSVSGGSAQTFAIKTDGSLWAWGFNHCGQLGDGTQENRLVPIKIMDNVAQVSTSFNHTLAIKTDGSLWAWGNNDFGQLGDGTLISSLTPKYIMSNVSMISAGNQFSMIVKGNAYDKPITINFNEGTAKLNGVVISSGTTINTDGSYTLEVKDNANNTVTRTFELDTTAPIISGLDTSNYITETPKITFNEGVGLLDDELFISGDKVTEVGKHTLVVTDSFGHTSEKTFTVFPALLIPSNFIASSQSYDSILLSWSSIENATAYEIYRSSTESGTYTLIATTEDTSYLNTGLTFNTLSFYRIRAKVTIESSSSFSGYSVLQSVKPVLSTNFSLAAHYTNFDANVLTWTTVSGATGYEVLFSTGTSTSYSLHGSTTNTSYTHLSLLTNTKYNYKIRAYRIVGSVKIYSEFSAIVSSTPYPLSPTLVGTSIDYNTLKVSWSGVSGANGYEISYRQEGTDTYTILTPTTSTTVTIGSLSTSVLYEIRGRSYRLVGTTKVYGSYSETILVNPIPNAPALTISSDGFDSLSIKWASIKGVSGYELYYLNPSTGKYELVIDTPSLSYVHSDLESGKTYSYYIKSYTPVDGVKVYSKDSSIYTGRPEPKMVTGIKLASYEYDRVNVSWDSVLGSTGYEISQSTSLTGTFTTIATVEGITNYTKTSLSFNTSYFYKVRSYITVSGSKVYGAWSSILTTKTLVSISTSVVSVSSNYNTNQISWNSVSGATGYELYYSKGTSTTYTLVKAMTTTSYSHTGLTTNTKYNYKVRAYRLVGSTKIYGAFSNVVYSTPIPSAPSASVASSGYNSLKVTWAAVTGATGYEVSYSSSEAGVYTKLALVTTTSASIPSLNTNTTYYIKVRTYRTVGTTKVYSGYSNIVTGVPIPSTTTLSVVSVDFETLKISWPAVLGASGYELYVINAENPTYEMILDTTSLFYSHSSLITGASQTYKLRAYRLVGETKVYGLYSTESMVSPLPQAVTDFKVTKQSVDQIELSWLSVKGATGYQISQSTSATGTFTSAGMIEGSNTYTVTGLAFNTTYYFRITAYTTVDRRDVHSSPSTVTTKTIPSPVVIAVSSQSDTSLQVNWSTITGAQGYEIYRSTSTSTTYTLLKTQTTVGYLNTGLVFNTKYNYKVRAYRLAGTTKIYGAYSSIVTGIPVYSSPGSLTVVSSGYNSLSVKWAVVAGASGYEVSYSTSESGVYSILPLVTSTSTSISSLTTNTSYFIKVRTYRLVGTTKVYGGYSSIVSSKPIPNAPVLSVTSIDYDSLQITWPAVTGASGYELYHLNSSTSVYELLSDTTSLTYVEDGLLTGVNTSYKIKAYRIVGDVKVYSLDSTIVSGKSIPSKVTGFILAMPGVSSLEFNWTGVEGATGYEVYRSTSATGTYVLVGTVEGVNTFTNTGLTFNTTYYFKIRPYTTVSSIKVYGEYNVAISALTIPSTVNLTATNPSYTTNSLSWSAISGADGYEIYFSTGSSTTYTLLKTVTSVSYTHISLVYNTTYNYKVRAYKLSGTTKIYGAYSSVKSATVLVTLSQSNAVIKATMYLTYLPFSREKLIEQLEYEGFTNEDAIYGVDHIGADWKQQAVLLALNYLKYTSLSRDRLIEQLEYEKFSTEEAIYGADHVGADWQQQAVLSAASYLEYSAFSRVALIKQLEYEKFSTEEAIYGVDHVGADWMRQAELEAQNYLKYMTFTKAGMIALLESEGFTNEEAVHGAEYVGL